MDLISRGNIVTVEVQVPLMLKGLKKWYGEEELKKILAILGVRKIEDFYSDKFHHLVDFYWLTQNKRMEYRNFKKNFIN